MKANKLLFSVALAAVMTVAGSGLAGAAPNPTSCDNDIDCVANPACGGDVCNWPAHKCEAAGSQPDADGWCSADSDCKCKGMGATCKDFFCTFTKPPTGGAGTGGGAGTTGAAGTGSAGTGGGAGTGGSSSSSSGGCSVAPSSTSGLGAGVGVGVFVGLGLVVGRLVRRRRRA
jgi:hypothetical protein